MLTLQNYRLCHRVKYIGGLEYQLHKQEDRLGALVLVAALWAFPAVDRRHTAAGAKVGCGAGAWFGVATPELANASVSASASCTL